jgi:hypothetical protein
MHLMVQYIRLQQAFILDAPWPFLFPYCKATVEAKVAPAFLLNPDHRWASLSHGAPHIISGRFYMCARHSPSPAISSAGAANKTTNALVLPFCTFPSEILCYIKEFTNSDIPSLRF